MLTSPPAWLLTVRVKEQLVLGEQPEVRKRKVKSGDKQEEGIAVTSAYLSHYFANKLKYMMNFDGVLAQRLI